MGASFHEVLAQVLCNGTHQADCKATTDNLVVVRTFHNKRRRPTATHWVHSPICMNLHCIQHNPKVGRVWALALALVLELVLALELVQVLAPAWALVLALALVSALVLAWAWGPVPP